MTPEQIELAAWELAKVAVFGGKITVDCGDYESADKVFSAARKLMSYIDFPENYA
jgi:hypothetical protein